MKRLSNSPLPNEKLRMSSDILRALAHPLRMQILEFIDHNRAVNVNKIYVALGLEQSITSQHLRILRQAGIVTTERLGKFIYYVVDYERVQEAARTAVIISAFVEYSPEDDFNNLDDDLDD
jgi:DNA-binding transcriptional ArsR family regulator